MATTSGRLLPTTVSGWWSVGAAIVMPVLFVIGSSFRNTLYATVPSGETILADIAARPALALTMLAGMGAGLLALLAGLVSILRDKERSVLVYVSSAVGALLALYLVAELLFPH